LNNSEEQKISRFTSVVDYVIPRLRMHKNKCFINICYIQDSCNNTFKEINNRKQRVYCLSYCLK